MHRSEAWAKDALAGDDIKSLGSFLATLQPPSRDTIHAMLAPTNTHCMMRCCCCHCRRIGSRLQDLLGPQAAVGCQVIATLLGTEDVRNQGIKYNQLLAAACGAGGTSRPASRGPTPCKWADSVQSSPAPAVA